MEQENCTQNDVGTVLDYKKHGIFLRTVVGDPCIYCGKGCCEMTKTRSRGWREKVAEWADRVGQWADSLLPAPAVPVPVSVRPRPKDRPTTR